MSSEWQAVGPPHKQRYLRVAAQPASAATSDDAHEAEKSSNGNRVQSMAQRLRRCAAELLTSKAFAKWLRQVTDLGVTAMRAEARRFRPGLDYTVATTMAQEDASCTSTATCAQHTDDHSDPANDATAGTAACADAAQARAPAPHLDATLCFVDDESDERRALWESDEVGGFQCYIAADEEAEAASESYRCAARFLSDLVRKCLAEDGHCMRPCVTSRMTGGRW